MIKPGVESSFRDQHTLERRIRIRQEGEQQGRKKCIVIIVERDRRCRNLPELVHCRYSISEGQKIMDIGNAIKKRMIAIDKKYENESLVLSLDHTIPSKDWRVKDIYETYKNAEDGLLYFKYSNMDPF